MKRILIILAAVALLLGGGLTAWIYAELRRPIAHEKTGKFIEIPPGSSTSFVVKKLASEGIIKHEWPLSIYLKLTGKGSTLKAGEYDFPSPISPLAALAKVQRGERRLSRFTVIEGWTRFEIAKAMTQMPELHVSTEAQAMELMDDVSLIHEIDPTAKNLEGYLYPETYEFAPETPAPKLVEMMVTQFLNVWKPDWSDAARRLNLTPREIVTVASIIETEAKLSEERPVVASVIYNRLQRDIPLAVDSSVIYASKLAGKWRYDGKVYKSDIERNSPYNVRIHPGLPPGPVASPGESSLKAALNPASTEYLYYVRNPDRYDGAHNFYSSSAEFEKGVQALRNWERQRDIEEARKKMTSPSPQ
jgi:UPF0755 protein